MGLYIKNVSQDQQSITVEVPPTRSDILHAADIAEDIGIAYGYNNIPKVFPPTNTIGKQIPQNKFSDLLRHELAQAGYIECLTMSLLSVKENYNFLRKEVKVDEAVHIANPKTLDFEMVRTSLIPGLLKTLQSNASESVSIIFLVYNCIYSYHKNCLKSVTLFFSMIHKKPQPETKEESQSCTWIQMPVSKSFTVP